MLGDTVIYTTPGGTEHTALVVRVRDEGLVDLAVFVAGTLRATSGGEAVRPLALDIDGVGNVPYDQAGADGTYRTIV